MFSIKYFHVLALQDLLGEKVKMHNMCIDPEPGEWILDIYMLSFVNSKLLLSEIRCKVKRRFYPVVLDLCEVPITDWWQGLWLISTRL